MLVWQVVDIAFERKSVKAANLEERRNYVKKKVKEKNDEAVLAQALKAEHKSIDVQSTARVDETPHRAEVESAQWAQIPKLVEDK